MLEVALPLDKVPVVDLVGRPAARLLQQLLQLALQRQQLPLLVGQLVSLESRRERKKDTRLLITNTSFKTNISKKSFCWRR